MIGTRSLKAIAHDVHTRNQGASSMGAFVLAAQRRLYGSDLAELSEQEWRELAAFVARTGAHPRPRRPAL